MKSLILMILFLLTGFYVQAKDVYPFEDQDFSCQAVEETGYTEPLYQDIFVIKVRKFGHSSISYKRKHPNRLDFTDLEFIRGCSYGKQNQDYYEDYISVKCASDGEEGSVRMNATTGLGSIAFYYPKIGYSERSELKISCEKI